tara:strand:+ start:353 stop:532 length:180 start_codon:yes stop_codon:yes gene_type:complete
MKLLSQNMALEINSLLFIQSSYQQKTINTEHFTRHVNIGINHTLIILGSDWEVSLELRA